MSQVLGDAAMRRKCKTHKCSVVALCIKDQCTNILACPRCLITFHSFCQNELVFLDDIEEENIDSLLTLKVFNEHLGINEKLKGLPKNVEVAQQNRTLIDEINKQFDQFLEFTTTKINDCRCSFIDMVSMTEECGIPNNLSTVMKLDEFKSFFMNTNENAADENNLKVVIGDNVKIISSELDMLKKHLNTYEKAKDHGRILENLDHHLISLKETIDSKLLKNKLMTERTFFGFDTFRKSTSIEISEDLKTARKTKLRGYHSAIMDIQLKKGCGIARWKLRLGGLEQTADHSSNQWINVGLIESNLSKDNENFQYEKCYGYTTFNQSYNMTIINKIEGSLTNIILDFSYDSNTGLFQISNDSKYFKAVATLSIYNTYYPFVLLYAPGNYVELIMD